MDDFHLGGLPDAGEPAPDGTVRVTFQCRLPRRHHREFLNEIAGLREVKGLTELEK